MRKVILSCRDVEDFMTDYVDGNLGVNTRLRFELHIAICSDCRKYLQTFRNALALEKRIFENPDDDAVGQVPDEVLDAIASVISNK